MKRNSIRVWWVKKSKSTQISNQTNETTSTMMKRESDKNLKGAGKTFFITKISILNILFFNYIERPEWPRPST